MNLCEAILWTHLDYAHAWPGLRRGLCDLATTGASGPLHDCRRVSETRRVSTGAAAAFTWARDMCRGLRTASRTARR